MNLPLPMRTSRRAAYSLLEVLVATAILLAGVGAAAALTLVMAAQEEAARDTARCLNLHEQAVRLWQLGVTPADISTSLLPAAGVDAITFDTPQSINVAGTILTSVNCTITYRTARIAAWTSPGTDTAVSNTLTAVRTNSP